MLYLTIVDGKSVSHEQTLGTKLKIVAKKARFWYLQTFQNQSHRAIITFSAMNVLSKAKKAMLSLYLSHIVCI